MCVCAEDGGTDCFFCFFLFNETLFLCSFRACEVKVSLLLCVCVCVCAESSWTSTEVTSTVYQ